MSKKSILEKSVFYACLAEVAEVVTTNIEFHESEANRYFELAYSDGELIDQYYENEYKKQVSKKSAYAEILEALNKL